MNDFFATLYDTIFGIYDPNYQLIFEQLDKGIGLYNYTFIGFIFILIPLIIITLFYFAYKNPYAKWWHWGISVIMAAIIVWFATRELAYQSIFETTNSELNVALSDPDYESYAINLTYRYANWNSFISLVISIIWSLFMIQFSKIQKHIPLKKK